MSFANYDDILHQIQLAGLEIAHLEVDTPRPMRCRVKDGGREKRGWVWLQSISLESPPNSGLYSQFIVGSYGIYRGNDNGKHKLTLNAKTTPLSADAKKAIEARHKACLRRAQAIRKAEQDKAAWKAHIAWSRYLPAAPEGGAASDYLRRKAVSGYGIRYSPSGNGTIAIPMTDDTGKVWGLQIIRGKDRGRKLEKLYWPAGMEKTGHYHMIGSPAAVILLCEGYATAASVHAASGLCTVVAFDANNLLPVAQALHKRWPRAHILICADDDYLTKGNPGVTAANTAALAVAGSVVQPQFPVDRAGKKLTDFNDLANVPEGGLHLVRAQLEAALAAAGVTPEHQAAAGDAQGEGEGERRAEAIMPLDDLVERFMPVDDGSGEYVFDQWTRKMARQKQMTSLMPAGVRMDDVKRHPRWRERGAAFIDQVGFDPTEKDPAVKLNTWKGWALTPSPEGSCAHTLALLDWLCSQESDSTAVSDWLLKWMAYPLQHPGAKMMSAVIMHGPQGTGKSTIFQALGKIYEGYNTILNQRGLEDKFNSDWVDSKLYVLAEEVVTRAEMWHIKNELKELVTGEWVRVNPKNLAAYRQRNHINIVYLSNENQPLPLENDDRRHLVVYTPPVMPVHRYAAVHDELKNGGLERFYWHLLHEVDTSDFSTHTPPPMTPSKQALIDLSLPSEATFIKDWQSGHLELNDKYGPMPFCPCTGRQLYTAYKRWAGHAGIVRPRDEIQFIGYVKRLPGWQAGKVVSTLRDLNGSAHISRKMVIPSAAALAEAAKAGATVIDEGDGSKTRGYWLAQCFFAFDSALEASKSHV